MGAVQQRFALGPRGEWREGLFVLTPREAEVLELMAEGLTAAEVAERLYVSPWTVRHHLKGAHRKLGQHTVAGAVVEAMRQGYFA